MVMFLETNILTSHAIVGEPLAELIHNNEEDTEWVAKHHFTLIDKRNSSIELIIYVKTSIITIVQILHYNVKVLNSKCWQKYRSTGKEMNFIFKIKSAHDA